jgi:hypothetical protein
MSTSAAPLSRTGNWLVLQIMPARWPLVVAAVAMVATLAGAWASVNLAPVGNRLDLVVTAQDGENPLDVTAAAAAQAELIRQLRALKLDVGGPPDGVRPCMRVHVVVGSRPGETPASVVATLRAQVDVVDDDTAGGVVEASMTGFGPHPWMAAQMAGQGVAWVGVGNIAAAIAPQHGRDATLRRVTDGRGALRVFARSRAELLLGRQERLVSVAAARAPRGPHMALTAPGEHARLLAAVSENRALVAVEERQVELLPTARGRARVVAGVQHLELRDDDGAVRLMTAYAFLGRGAVSPDGHTVSVVVMQGDDSVSLCTLRSSGEALACLPVEDVAQADVLAVDNTGGNTVARVTRCPGRCLQELLWWTPGQQPAARSTVVEDVDRVDITPSGLSWQEGDGEHHLTARTWRSSRAQPTRGATTRESLLGPTVWRAPLKAGGQLELSSEPGVVGRGRLERVAPGGSRSTLLTAPNTDWSPILSPGGESVFLELVQPDPDANVEWTQVVRVHVP